MELAPPPVNFNQFNVVLINYNFNDNKWTVYMAIF